MINHNSLLIQETCEHPRRKRNKINREKFRMRLKSNLHTFPFNCTRDAQFINNPACSKYIDCSLYTCN